MRYATKFDSWLVAVLVIGAAVTMIPAFVHPPDPPVKWLPYLLPLFWVVLLPLMLPQYYEVRSEGLFIRQGLRKILIPWPELAEMTPTTDGRSAAVFSMDRILVSTSRGKRYLIAAADRAGLIAACAERCPHLERKAGGIGLPLMWPSTR